MIELLCEIKTLPCIAAVYNIITANSVTKEKITKKLQKLRIGNDGGKRCVEKICESASSSRLILVNQMEKSKPRSNRTDLI